MKLKIKCDFCGREFERDAIHLKGKRHHFCCRQCMHSYSSKKENPEKYHDYADWSKNGQRFSELNKRLNPTRMTPKTREKLREARLNAGEGKTYTKIYGVHEHRVVAENLLGRALRKGEIVHHRDGNKRNNAPENLVVFPSAADHSRHHAELRWFIRKIKEMEEGDAQ